MDELPEFSQRVLKALRQPIEDARVGGSRSAGTAHLPRPLPARRRRQSLPPRLRLAPDLRLLPRGAARYLARLSRPLLDRIDLHLEILTLAYA